MKFKFTSPPVVQSEPPKPELHVSSEPNGNPSAVVAGFVPKCCDCLRHAEVIAKGSTLCKPCYEERLRMGKI